MSIPLSYASPSARSRSHAVVGHIHSIETCGAVDGPGLRFVVFTAGCPLRCLYCQNPDCRFVDDGRQVTVDEMVSEIQKYASYMRASHGGVTISGGEPLSQPHFTAELLQRCQALGIHTALDTSGYCDLAVAKPAIAAADLVLLDIKSFDPQTYKKVTQVSIAPTLELARYLAQIHKPVWIRFVLVPGLTDAPANVSALADFIAPMANVQQVEVLPFHKMGEYKWEQLGYKYQLQATQPPTAAQIQQVVDIFRSRGLSVR